MIDWLASNSWVLGLAVVLFFVWVWRSLRTADHDDEESGEQSRADELGLPKPDSVEAGMVVTRMAVSGHVRIRDASGERVEDLPPSPRGEGEMPEGIWAAPGGGPLFVVGKLYSGQPGPDDGVIYRKDPGGEWEIVYTLPERTLHRVCGTALDDVLAGAIGGIVHFDGTEFRFTELPYPMMIKTWREPDGLIAQAFDGSCTFLVRHGVPEPTHEREEPDTDRYTFVEGQTEYRVFDRMVEVGPATIGEDEAAEIRDELAQVAEILDKQG